METKQIIELQEAKQEIAKKYWFEEVQLDGVY